MLGTPSEHPVETGPESPEATTKTRAVVDDLDCLASTPPGSHRLMQAALEAFAATGYHGASTRDVAARAGMSPAALYIRFDSKAELLREISVAGHSHVRDQVRSAILEEREPIERLRSMVATFVAWHANYHKVARVVQYEMSALSPEAYEEVAAIRRETERVFRSAVKEAMQPRSLDQAELAATTRAILSMAIDVARWYTSKSTPAPDELGRLYAELVLRMLRLPAADPD